MGIDADFAGAFFKAQAAAGNTLPHRAGEGKRAFVSVKDADKPAVVGPGPAAGGARLRGAGHRRHRTPTWPREGIPTTPVRKVKEGRPSIVDRIKDGDVHFVVNTTAGKREVSDSYSIRRETLMKAVPVLHHHDRRPRRAWWRWRRPATPGRRGPLPAGVPRLAGR